MAILWCGGEDIDFPNGVAVGVETSSSLRRTSSPVGSRCAITPPSGSVVAKSTLFPGGGITAGWLSAQIYTCGFNSGNGFIGFGASGSVKGIFLGLTANGNIIVGKYDGTTWTLLATGDPVWIAGLTYSLHRVDMQLIDYGASGQIKVYVDQSMTANINYSGDISIGGVASLNSVFLKGSSGHNISEIIVADEDTRGMYLLTQAPNAAGDLEEWTGTYTAIDEITNNDADSVYTNVAVKEQRVNLLPTPAGTLAVKAAMLSVRAGRSTDSTPTKLSIGIRSGSTTDVDAAADPGNGIWQTRIRLMTTNPITAAAWTQAELDAVQAVLKSVA